MSALTELALDVRAPSPDLFFNVLRDSIEDLITRRWPGLSYDLLIPCPERDLDDHRCPGSFPLRGLLLIRERAQTDTVPCMQCAQLHAISELLTGFAPSDTPIQAELDRLHDDLAEIQVGVARMEGYAADALRRMLGAVSTEITDCPRLFTFTQQDPAGTRRVKFWQRQYRLVLWCEHPGHWHPWGQASYNIDQPQDWLLKIGPYAALIVKTLQLVVPLASPVADMLLTSEQLQQAQNELQLMTTLIAALPSKPPGDNIVIPDITGQMEPERQLTSAQGAAARMSRVLIFKLDPSRQFGAYALAWRSL